MEDAQASLRLSDEEVKFRLGSYRDSGITDELYEFGMMLLNDSVSRLSSLDAKAALFAGYSGAIITIILSTSGIWFRVLDHKSLWLVLLAILSIALAGGFSICSIALQRTEWFSANEWIRKECLDTREALRRYHLLCMWGIVTSHQEKCRTKVGRLRVSQWLLAVSFVFLLLSLFEIARTHAAF